MNQDMSKLKHGRYFCFQPVPPGMLRSRNQISFQVAGWQEGAKPCQHGSVSNDPAMKPNFHFAAHHK